MPLDIAFPLGTMLGDSLRWPQDDLIAPMLILVLGMAMGICFICLILVVHHVRAQPSKPRPLSWRRPQPVEYDSPSVSIYPPPSRWAAVHTHDLQALQQALGIHDPMPCTWEEGLGSMDDQKLFLSPPIRGWVVVMGASLPDPSVEVDQCFRFVQTLSRRFGRVQFFQAERVVNHHAWILADRGGIQRAYAWADATQWNQGVMTRDEIDLQLRCYDYLESIETMGYDELSPLVLNTDRVVMLAARWSIDPTSINPRGLRDETGITGRPGRSIAY